jgi:hypothetical protein
MQQLNENNFLIYAIKNYYASGSIGMTDLEEDLKRFKYLKRLLNRYQRSGDMSERLILNHLVVLYNVFGDAATSMLFYKLEKEFWSDLKTYLVYLQRMPLETVVSPGIIETDIPLNYEIIEVLRKL